jgi:hypothetical protein
VPILQAVEFETRQLGLSRGVSSDSSSSRDNQVIINPASRKKLVERGSGENLRCDHDGCKYKGTFPRQWELQRHIASKHTAEKPYWCPVAGCVKGNGAPAFARPDKLTAHVRAIHYGKDVKAVCPANTCTDKALTLDLLGVHVKSEHLKNRHEGVIGGMLRAMANAASADHRRCPVWFCKVRVGLEDFPSHLLRHTNEELAVVASELAEEGYLLNKSDCEHDDEEVVLAGGWCICKVTSIGLECPVCMSHHRDRQSLKAHMEEVHTGRSEDLATFRQRILALVGMEATSALGKDVWSDVMCQI